MIFIQRMKFSVIISVLFSIPTLIYASALTPVVPQTPTSCPLGYGALLSMIHNILNDAVILAGMFAVLLIAYAGFIFVFNSTAPEMISKGRKILISTIIGFVIVLSAWLIVNEVVVMFTTGNLQSVTSLLEPSGSNICIQSSTP